MAENFVFHRADLAARMTDIVLGRNPLAGNTGLFLAAPRRTGKSTFLQVDLIPALDAAGVLPIYVDLWADRSRDPAELILDALKSTIHDLDPGLTKAVRRAGLSKLGFGSWLSIDLDRVGTPGGATLTEVIRRLIERKGRPVVLVIDEAQHAITTETGATTLFSIKSARDTLNATAKETVWGNVNLGLVFTGSNRDKLSSLVTGRGQPFFGSGITPFPLLDHAYTDAFTAFINDKLAVDRRLDPEEVHAAFRIVEHRPQLLLAAVNAHVLGALGEAVMPSTLREQAADIRERYWSEFDVQWAGLSPLQQAVLTRLIAQSVQFRPFESAALAAYAEATDRSVTASDVQAALDVLRGRNLVVRLERGLYTLDDASLTDWFAARSP